LEFELCEGEEDVLEAEELRLVGGAKRLHPLVEGVPLIVRRQRLLKDRPGGPSAFPRGAHHHKTVVDRRVLLLRVLWLVRLRWENQRGEVNRNIGGSVFVIGHTEEREGDRGEVGEGVASAELKEFEAAIEEKIGAEGRIESSEGSRMRLTIKCMRD